MFGSENMKIVKPEERRAYVPSDVMSLAQYVEFKRKFNERLAAENVKIEAFNVKAKANSQPLKPELEPYPMETVLMICDKQFILTRIDLRRILFPRGIFNCPVELVDDWYLRANGAQVYTHPTLSPLKDEPIKAPAFESPFKNLAASKRGKAKDAANSEG